MKTITVAGVDIDIHDGPIGISMSGGADSSLLFNILLNYATGPIHVIHLCAKYHQRALIKKVTEVVGYCLDNVSTKTEVILHSHFIYRTIPPIGKTIGNEYVEKGIVNYVYSGMTALPSEKEQLTFNVVGPETIYRDRAVGETKLKYNNGIYSPFIDIDKKVIKQMYDELDLTTTLFPITRSCDNPAWTEGSCCECWWCEERKWAFGTYY
jgi:7-cyano-7-deazaguanine synthase in queuosine biosynthesis